MAKKHESPLACLPEQPDGMMKRELTENGWEYAGSGPVPVLKGIKGKWFGYEKGYDWLSAYGWPNDLLPYKTMELYREDRVVGHLWFYHSASKPKLDVLFVFKSMTRSTDDQGEHEGEHDFCWWGELIT